MKDDTDEIILKGMNIEDCGNLAEMFKWRNDPRIYQWCRQETLLNYEKHKNYWKKIQNSHTDKMFQIYRNDGRYAQGEDELAGVCGLTNINWTARHGEFSIYIGPEFQRIGYARKALNDLINIAFDDLNLLKVWGESFEGNPAITLFKELGFKESPGHKKHYFKNGKLIDTYFYTKERVLNE
jgi:RimJ/RimL family protein N-acetyltransferase